MTKMDAEEKNKEVDGDVEEYRHSSSEKKKKKKKKKKYDDYEDEVQIFISLPTAIGTDFLAPNFFENNAFEDLTISELQEFAENFNNDVGLSTLKKYYEACRHLVNFTYDMSGILVQNPGMSKEEAVESLPDVQCYTYISENDRLVTRFIGEIVADEKWLI